MGLSPETKFCAFKDKHKWKKKKQKIMPVEDNSIEVIDLENDQSDS